MHGLEHNRLQRLLFTGLAGLCAAIFLLAACTPAQNPNSPAEGTAVPQVTSGTLEMPTTESGAGDQTPQATSATNGDLTSVPGSETTPMTGTTTTDTGTPEATTTSNP